MKNVLVVDDNQQVRNLLSILLTDAGYQVDSCADGNEVLERIRNQAPDVVLMDLNMPEVDGFSALQQIKQDDAMRHIPVIMVTASGQRQLFDQARDLGAADFVIKPWKDNEIEDRIELALSKV